MSSLVSSKTPPSGDTWQSVLTSPLGWVGGFALIFWLVLKTAVGRTDAVGRARYARDCRRAMAKHYTELHKAMGNPQPPREIKKVMAGVMLTADAAIDRGVWPLHPPMATATQFPLELGGQIAHIRETFMHQWDPPPERGG